MRNSALQPPSSRLVATCQLPSQFRLKPPPEPACWRPPPRPPPRNPPLPPPWSTTWPSYWIPAGLVPKTNPFWPVLIGIEDQEHGVGPVQVGVTDALALDELTGLIVGRANRHVQVGFVLRHPHPGVLRGRLAVARCALHEARHGPSFGPSFVIGHAVQYRRLGDAGHRHGHRCGGGLPSGLGAAVLPSRSGGDHGEQREGDRRRH